MRNYISILIATGIILSCVMTGCIWIFRSVEIDENKPVNQTDSPFKAHLKDGKIALFPDGATFGDYIIGYGTIYKANLEFYKTIDSLEVDKVAAYSVFNEEVNGDKSALVSLGLSAGVAILTPYLINVIFGSCPTVYSDEKEPVLRGELFSNSIAPMLEARDLITVGSQRSDTEYFSLEIRNEALETHYLNHLELIEVEHEKGSVMVPTSKNMVLSLKDFTVPVTAITKSGSDVMGLFSIYDPNNSSDGYTFDDWTITDNNEEPAWDYIDLVFPPSIDQSALHLRLKNSLLSTVLLYDYYLSGQGINALKWLAEDLATVSEAIALGVFHNTYMGMRVQQQIDGEYVQVDRVPNVGPVSWKDLAVPLESSGQDSIRIRLSFLAGLWKLQNARLATSISEPEITIIPASGVYDAKDEDLTIATSIQAADDSYLVTNPGEHFFIKFKTNVTANEKEKSYLLAGQGYYTEWIREDWIKEARFTDGIEYNSELIVDAQNRWKFVRSDIEERFFNSKVPVK